MRRQSAISGQLDPLGIGLRGIGVSGQSNGLKPVQLGVAVPLQITGEQLNHYGWIGWPLSKRPCQRTHSHTHNECHHQDYFWVEDTRFLLSELSLIGSQSRETGGAGYGNPTAGFDYLKHYEAFGSVIQVFSGSRKSFSSGKLLASSTVLSKKTLYPALFQPRTLFDFLSCPKLKASLLIFSTHPPIS